MADASPRRRRSNTPPDDRPPMPEDTTPKQEQEKPPPSPGKPASKVLQQKLTQFFVSLALPFAAAGDTHCAGILIQRGPVVAEAWANLAAESPAVKKTLEGLLKGGAWAGAISSTMAIVVPIAAHHGAPIPDFISPIVLGGYESQPQQTSQPRNPEEVIIVPPPPTDNPAAGAGRTPAPGPAAYSAPNPGSNGADPRDPSNYPGVAN